MSTRSSDETPPLKVGDLVDSQFKIIQILGQGGFGAVFEALDLRSKHTCALKIELITPLEDEPGLLLEAGVLKRLQKSKHFPRFIHCGKHGTLTYLVMQMLGDTLYFLRKKCPEKRYSLSTSLQLGTQCIEGIQAMHDADLLHRDIKPENFMIGSTPADRRTVFLLDFGLVRRYRYNGQIRNARPIAAFRGTYAYASARVLSCVDAGRCDDLIGWIYMLIEFMKGTLPWSERNLSRKKLADYKLSKVKELVEGTPNEIAKVYELISKLQYADAPPYERIKELVQQIVTREKILSTEPFDFEPGGTYYDTIFANIEARRQHTKIKREVELKSRKSIDELTAKTFILQ